MATSKLCSLLLVLCLTYNAESVQWTSEIKNNAVIFACHGQDLILPWNVSSSIDNIYTIQWYYQGLSEEVIAVMAHGHFIPTPTFSGRVEFLSRAGIVLKNVIPSDKGNYSVEVGLLSQGGAERQNAVVDISAAPSTSSGDLDLQQDRTAVHNDRTGEWSVQLTCGHFTALGHPPVDVVWTTPTGGTLHSTIYNGGNFHLILPNPVRGGNYSCAIAPQSPAASCLPGLSPLLRKAVVNVDEYGARLTLIEARQSETSANLSSYIHYLEDKDANLTSQIHYLEDKDANLTSQVHSLTSQIDYMEDKDANLTSQIHYLEDKDANLTSQVHSLTSQIHYLEDKDDNLTSEIHRLQGFTACGLAYNVLSDAWRATTNTNTTSYHCDSTLPAGWYRFELNGADAVIPTSCVQGEPSFHCGTNGPAWLDLQGQSLPGVGQEVQARSCGSWSGNCCHVEHSKPVTVRNCGTFYVYNLQPLVCNTVYCTTSH